MPKKEGKKKFDFTFAALEETVLKELGKPRTKAQIPKLIACFHTIWDCYIRFYLYQNRVYNGHYEFDDIYSDIYEKCIDVLPRITDLNYNRVKCYYNSCISGWIKNRLYTTRKRQVTLVSDVAVWDAVIATIPDRENIEESVDCKLDIATMNKHLQKQTVIYKELVGLVGLSESRVALEEATQRFISKAYESFNASGELLTAVEYLTKSTGALFGKRIM